MTDIWGCLLSMQLPWFSLCGKMIFVVLRCLWRNAWEYIMALTLMGVRHLISPRWLEKMSSFSLSLSLSQPQGCVVAVHKTHVCPSHHDVS